MSHEGDFFDNDDFVDRRRHGCLSEEQINDIAERAADKAVEKITNHLYQEIGKTLIQKTLWLIGVCFFGLGLWLNSKGLFKVD